MLIDTIGGAKSSRVVYSIVVASAKICCRGHKNCRLNAENKGKSTPLLAAYLCWGTGYGAFTLVYFSGIY